MTVSGNGCAHTHTTNEEVIEDGRRKLVMTCDNPGCRARLDAVDLGPANGDD